jgi:hypothetical protein
MALKIIPNPTPDLLTFEVMRNHYSSGDGYVYQGSRHAITCYVNGDATPKERKAAGIGHLKPGRVYVFLSTGECTQSHIRTIVRHLQREWDNRRLLPEYLRTDREHLRELLTLAAVVS